MDPQPSQPTPENAPVPQTDAKVVATEVTTAEDMAGPRGYTGELSRNQFQILIFAYALINFFGPIVFEGGGPDIWPLLAIWSGALFAQGVFLTIWAALGPYRLLIRWALVLLYAFILFYSCFLGIIAIEQHTTVTEIFVVMFASSLLIPLFFLIVQIPLWIRRTISGWEIIPVEKVDTHQATQSRQFGLAHILGLMSFLAVALSLAQVTNSTLNTYSRELDGPISYMIWIFLGLYGGIFFLYVTVWAGPALRACFLAQDKGTGCGIMALLWIVVSFSMILVFVIPSMIFGNHLDIPIEIVVSLFLHFGTMVFVLMLSLHFLRACGYAMVRVQRAQPQSPLPNVEQEGECPFAEQPKEEEPPTG